MRLFCYLCLRRFYWRKKRTSETSDLHAGDFTNLNVELSESTPPRVQPEELSPRKYSPNFCTEVARKYGHVIRSWSLKKQLFTTKIAWWTWRRRVRSFGWVRFFLDQIHVWFQQKRMHMISSEASVCDLSGSSFHTSGSTGSQCVASLRSEAIYVVTD